MKYELDATNQTLGRLSSQISILLRGKNQATYQPHLTPDNEVTVSNIDKLRFTGAKLAGKLYHHFSGYPSGISTRTLGQLWEKKPREVIRQCVYNMLPQNRTRDVIIKNLKFK